VKLTSRSAFANAAIAPGGASGLRASLPGRADLAGAAETEVRAGSTREGHAQASPLLSSTGGGGEVLLTLAIILLIAWLLGLVAFHVTAWFIHILIVLAVIIFILHFVRGRPAV
jgi:hypothetical protein